MFGNTTYTLYLLSTTCSVFPRTDTVACLLEGGIYSRVMFITLGSTHVMHVQPSTWSASLPSEATNDGEEDALIRDSRGRWGRVT